MVYWPVDLFSVVERGGGVLFMSAAVLKIDIQYFQSGTKRKTTLTARMSLSVVSQLCQLDEVFGLSV